MRDDSVITSHHEKTPHHQAAFSKDTNLLITTFNELGNPLLESSKELLTLNTKDFMTEGAVQSILSAKELGATQHQEFVADRVINSKVPITDTLPQNNLLLFYNKPSKKPLNRFLRQVLKKTVSFF